MDRLNRVIRAAGILEGEGSFQVCANNRLRVVCQMSDKDVIEELRDLFGGYFAFVPRRFDHYKDTWRWTVEGSNAVRVAEEIRPFMFARRTEAIDKLVGVWYTKETKKKDRVSLIDEAARDYLNGKESLRSVAARYGISHEAVRVAANKI